MNISVDQLVQQIHDAPARIVLAVSGGGSRAIADLLEVPGASRTLLAAEVPYSDQAMIEYLGSRPDEFCSNRTARAMAMTAFLHAMKLGQADAQTGAKGTSASGAAAGLTGHLSGAAAGLSGSADNLCGIACTAGLLTDRPRRGSHRIHAAMQTASLTVTWSLNLLKDRRSRAEEERLAGHLLLNVVAECCGLAPRLTLDLLEGEKIEQSHTEAQASWRDLLLGRIEFVFQGNSLPANPAIISGAFNPVHIGHRRILDVGADLLKKPVLLEMSILNPDKPPLDYHEIERRIGQFAQQQPLVLTRASTFEEKARLFPGATFLLGVDTLRRIALDRYYHDDPAACRKCLEYIAARGCRFLVFGRDMGTGFMQLADLDLPDVLRKICRDVPPEIFREDISSTSIRKSGAW
jgi:nicotinamide mononucleotide (NMN) deamidase PncC